MSKLFSVSRLKLARERRQLTYKGLAEKCHMSSKMLSLYENSPMEHVPTEKAVERISIALSFPKEFFYEDDVEDLEFDSVAFRSLKTIRVAQQNAALGAGKIGILLNDYFEARFELPCHQLPDLSSLSPEEAAVVLRTEWHLGDKSISNMINLLEAFGIRVFSLSEDAQEVDAFSFWKGGTPFIFLNTKKTAERSRFDSAHELGHLVLHRYSLNKGIEIEKEADRFASAFLMPESSIRVSAPSFVTTKKIIELKARWKVSAMALSYRLKALDLLTDWQYRNIMIELSRLGYRSGEPCGIDRERSTLIDNLLKQLSLDGIFLKDISKELKLPIEEISSLMFRVGLVLSSREAGPSVSSRLIKKPDLYLV